MWSGLAVVLSFVLVSFVVLATEEGEPEEHHVDPTEDLIAQLRSNANLDLSRDEEYEDLRAELLAYHSALTKLTSGISGRRSMGTTACWQMGGVCINFRLCNGHRFLTQVPGCKDRLNVCCFAWNRYETKDYRAHGIPALHYPWPLKYEFGGQGVVAAHEYKGKSKKSKKGKRNKNKTNLRNQTNSETLALILTS